MPNNGKYREEILKLISEGIPLKEIAKIVGCSRFTVYYHLPHRKIKQAEYHKRRSVESPLIRKLSGFIKGSKSKISIQQLRDHIGDIPICYLTGTPINLRDGLSYELDHIIPKSSGGSSDLKNLGLLSAEVNRAKHNKTPEQFLEICRKVIDYSGNQFSP